MLGVDEPIQAGSGEAGLERGWFDPAYVAGVSVFDSLQQVIVQETSRFTFVTALQAKLAPVKEAPLDLVTDLSGRLAVFSNTLKFRLGLLAPERTGAWFRDAMRCTGGPFPQQILADPVFNAFHPTSTHAVATKIRASFAARKVEEIPFLKQESCLWLTLLELNREWDELCRIQVAGETYRLDILPDGLPAPLCSQTLHTFLQNVRAALLQARSSLDESYWGLWHASEQFFKHMDLLASQQQQQQQKQQKTKTTNPKGADDLRESMRHRRAHLVKQRTLSIKERRALEFMQFDAYPDALQLKKRYYTLARKYHPDSPSGNEEEFKKLGMFYNYLVECLKHHPLEGE